MNNNYQMPQFYGSHTISRSSRMHQQVPVVAAGSFNQPLLLHEGANSAGQSEHEQQVRVGGVRRRGQMPQQFAAQQQQQIYRDPQAYLTMPTNMNHNKPLCRCRVMYLGSSVPHITKNGLHGIQEPLKHLYPDEQFSGCSNLPSQQQQQASNNNNIIGDDNKIRTTIDISHLSSQLGIDSWLSVWSNGLLLENVDEFGREIRRFFSIESLHYCAAVRHFNTSSLDPPSELAGDENNNNNTTNDHQAAHSNAPKQQQPSRFLPLDAPIFQYPGMLDANHPPVFASIMRRTSGVKVLECHAFICRRDAAANALVRCCTHAYADFLSAKRLSTELNLANCNYYAQPMAPIGYPHQLAASMTMPNRAKRSQQDTYQVVEAIINEQKQQQRPLDGGKLHSGNKCRVGSNRLDLKRHHSVENSAIVTSNSSNSSTSSCVQASDHSLQSTAADDNENNYAIISAGQQQERALSNQLGAAHTRSGHSKRAKSKARKVGSSRSLFKDFQPPQLPLPPPPQMAASCAGLSCKQQQEQQRLSHSLDQLAEFKAPEEAHLRHGKGVTKRSVIQTTKNDLENSSAYESETDKGQQQLEESQAVRYALVSRKVQQKRHSKSMQNLQQPEAQSAQLRQAAAGQQLQHDQVDKFCAKSRKSHSEMSIPQRSSTLRRRRERHRSDASSVGAGPEWTPSSSDHSTNKSAGGYSARHSNRPPLEHTNELSQNQLALETTPASCCERQQHSSRSRRNRKSSERDSKQARSKSQTGSDTMWSEQERVGAHSAREPLGQFAATNLSSFYSPPAPQGPPPLPPPPPPPPQPPSQHPAATAAALHYQTLPNSQAAAAAAAAAYYSAAAAAAAHYAPPVPPQPFAYYAQPFVPAPPQPIYEPFQQHYTNYQQTYHHLARMQILQQHSKTLGRQSLPVDSRSTNKANLQQQQQQVAGASKQSTSATRFRCLSPPVNLLWGANCDNSKRNSGSTIVGNLEEFGGASRRTSGLYSIASLLTNGQQPQLASKRTSTSSERRQSKLSANQLDQVESDEATRQTLGSNGAAVVLAPSPAVSSQSGAQQDQVQQNQQQVVVVSAKPCFKQTREPRARLSWIKRLSLSMSGSGSVRGQSTESAARPSLDPAHSNEQLQRASTCSAAPLDSAQAASSLVEPVAEQPEEQQQPTGSTGATDTSPAATAAQSPQKKGSRTNGKRRRGFFAGALTLGRSSAKTTKSNTEN